MAKFVKIWELQLVLLHLETPNQHVGVVVLKDGLGLIVKLQ